MAVMVGVIGGDRLAVVEKSMLLNCLIFQHTDISFEFTKLNLSLKYKIFVDL